MNEKNLEILEDEINFSRFLRDKMNSRWESEATAEALPR